MAGPSWTSWTCHLPWLRACFDCSPKLKKVPEIGHHSFWKATWLPSQRRTRLTSRMIFDPLCSSQWFTVAGPPCEHDKPFGCSNPTSTRMPLVSFPHVKRGNPGFRSKGWTGSPGTPRPLWNWDWLPESLQLHPAGAFVLSSSPSWTSTSLASSLAALYWVFHSTLPCLEPG